MWSVLVVRNSKVNFFSILKIVFKNQNSETTIEIFQYFSFLSGGPRSSWKNYRLTLVSASFYSCRFDTKLNRNGSPFSLFQSTRRSSSQSWHRPVTAIIASRHCRVFRYKINCEYEWKPRKIYLFRNWTHTKWEIGK